ncbi:MAG: DEDD exonuclease domain-containing protein [Acidimicrobiia bacterium]
MTLVGQRSFNDMGASLAEVPFCVLDLETTGLTPDSCEITEIGAVRFEGGVETGRFQTLVNPRAPIPPTVTVVTGITQAMVIEAPLIEEALPAFLEFIGDAVIVGHNVRFDISFLNAASLRLGYGRLSNQSADTMRLARRLLSTEVRSLKLSKLAAYLGSPTTPNHRALQDALATAHIFFALLERAGSIGVTHLDDLLALPTIKGSRAIGKLSLTEGLPRGPGVYLFKDGAGSPIYIGKATNLRSRVRSYFSGDPRRNVANILRDVKTIDHLRASSEIEAAVTEIRLITEHSPRYNRRSKPPKSLHWVRITDEAFPRLSVVRSVGRGRLHLGPFRNKRSADRVVRALWDASRIRRCSKPGRACHYAQLGWALCPCDGTVSEDEYGRMIDDLVASLSTHPESLADKLRSRLASLSQHQRFEEAAHCRDSWASLATALQRGREWDALQKAGRIVARREEIWIAVDRGALVGAWTDGGPVPLLPHEVPAQSDSPVSMLASDEAALLWQWLNSPGVELIAVDEPLSLPVHAIPTLAATA